MKWSTWWRRRWYRRARGAGTRVDEEAEAAGEVRPEVSHSLRICRVKASGSIHAWSNWHPDRHSLSATSCWLHCVQHPVWNDAWKWTHRAVFIPLTILVKIQMAAVLFVLSLHTCDCSAVLGSFDDNWWWRQLVVNCEQPFDLTSLPLKKGAKLYSSRLCDTFALFSTLCHPSPIASQIRMLPTPLLVTPPPTHRCHPPRTCLPQPQCGAASAKYLAFVAKSLVDLSTCAQ